MKNTTNKGNRNADLRKAKEAKKDEFYTQLEDIFNELKHYKDHFAGKTVLCNCDDPYESNFFKYFAMEFNKIKLKKLICTCWDGSPIAQQDLVLFEDEKKDESGRSRIAYKIELTEVKDLNGDGATDIDDVRLLLEQNTPQRLNGNGDFRSDECVELLKEADIVVTNPPFSLFREYVAQLMYYGKKFLIIGNLNAVTYKEIFPYLRQNEIWLGPSITNGDRKFYVPDDYELNAAGCGVEEDGRKFIRVKGVRWFTNLDHKKRHEKLDLYKRYTPEEFPKYDNYDAINVDVTADIPMDYDGVMGVPISFLDKYCPEQFEIIGTGTGDMAKEIGVRKNYRGRTDIAYTVNGISKCPFGRILIRRK